MVASLLLLIVLLGVVPMFSRSMVSNVAGNEYTKVSNEARSRAEEYRKLPFNSVNLTVDVGTTEKIVEDFFSRADHQWKPGKAPTDGSDPALWQRSTTVRQYGISAFLDGSLVASEALDGGVAAAFVHIKEVEVTVQGQLQTANLGSAKGLTVRVLKFK